MTTLEGSALPRALARYRRAPLGDRLFVRGRVYMADLPAVERHVPRAGQVVELGCGRGLFSNLLADASSARDVLGIDSDDRRLAVARLTERPGLRFELGDARTAEIPPCDAVVLVDVLYLMNPDDQTQVLTRSAAALRTGGRLVVHAQERRSDPRFWLGYAQETVATGLSLTRGRSGGLHYCSRAEMRARLESVGLEVEVFPLRGRLYTDAVYVGVKAA